MNYLHNSQSAGQFTKLLITLHYGLKNPELPTAAPGKGDNHEKIMKRINTGNFFYFSM